MSKRKSTLIETENFILKESFVDSDGESVWTITNPRDKNSMFYVHCRPSGSLHITFFKKVYCNSTFTVSGLKKLCEILLEDYKILTINIYYKNTALITLCSRVGFKKQKDVKHLYCLKKVK